MRHGVPCAPFPLTPPPLLPPSPPPAPVYSSALSAQDKNMLLSVFLALFLPCAGMSVVFMVYVCLLWYSTSSPVDIPGSMKQAGEKGLSAAELESLPKVTGKELVMGNECAVCLDDVESEQPARLVPGCNHGFHLECADAWLSKCSACPVCRAKVDAQFFSASLENPC